MEALRPLFAHRPQQRESNEQEGQHDHQAEQVGAQKAWVIHCTAWGNGAEAVLRYLARYMFRVAITERRIVDIDVTIRCKHRKSGAWRTTRLDGHEIMRRFLQHVLPKGLRNETGLLQEAGK